MGFFSSRKADIDQALADVNSGKDPNGDKLTKLIEHTIAETGGGDLSEHEKNFLRSLKGK